MDAILHKPFTVKKLAECIGSFLTPSTMQETDMAKSVFVQASAAQDDLELLDAETIDRLLQMAQSGRRDFIDRILTLCQNHAPRVLLPTCIKRRTAARYRRRRRGTHPEIDEPQFGRRQACRAPRQNRSCGQEFAHDSAAT
jgi:hypothetical protein